MTTGPKESGELLVSLQSYDDWGRAFASQPKREDKDGNLTPLQAASLVVYDELGDVLYSGLDIDGELKPASMDRITQSDTTYERDPDGHLWQIRKSWTWPKDNDATRVLISETHTRNGNLGEVDEEHGQLISISKNFRPTKRKTGRGTDLQSVSTTRAYRNREASTQTTITETATGHQTIQVTVGGLLRSVAQYERDPSDPTAYRSLFTAHYQYDALGRRIGITDSRTGKSTIEYDPKTGFVTKTTDIDNNTTTYTYYGQGEPGAGKVKSITNPHKKTQWFRYNQRGQKVMTWGLTDYPVVYQYDAFGDLHKMYTTHIDPFADWLVRTSPEPPTLEEWFARTKTNSTTWIRDPFTRQVIRKEYADGKGNNFVYSVDGKLIQETSARGAKKVREYDNRTGELAKITTTLDGETTETIYERDRMGNVDRHHRWRRPPHF